MKDFIRISAFCCMVVLWANAKAQFTLSLADGSVSAAAEAAMPERSIEYAYDGITVAYSFKSALLTPSPEREDAYFWKTGGFGTCDVFGDYARPFRNDIFSVPENCAAVVDVVDSAFNDYRYSLAPARRIKERNDILVVAGKPEPLTAERIGFYPLSVAGIYEKPAVYRGRGMLNVQVCPVQYDASTKTVRAYTYIKYKVRFVPSKEVRTAGADVTVTPKMAAGDSFLSNVTLNGTAATQGGMTQRATGFSTADAARDYLIISTDKFADAVGRFAKWKEMLGFRVHTVLKDSWSGSDEIKAAVKDVYDNCEALYYLLIVGDHEDVPGQYSEIHADDGDFSAHYTDFYYGCMDGGDDMQPDIYRGRLSVSTPEEAAVVVDKIIKYEQAPPADDSFYAAGVNCADFIDDEEGWSDHYEDRRYVQTAEEIRDYMLLQGKQVERVYTTKYEITPMYWNRGVLSFGQPIPQELLKPDFAWNGSEKDIRGAIDRGVFYVMHRDHGLFNCWENPFFSTKHVEQLNNGDLLPVVFCINCDNGAFQDNSLAESFLRKQGGGAVAVFAASDMSYSGYNDALAYGMFDAIWPSPGLRATFPGVNSIGGVTPEPTYELGQILDQAQIRVSETFGSPDPEISSNEKNDAFCRKVTKEIYHCFGDPSMRIYTEKPVAFAKASVLREDGGITAATGGEVARITFCNRKTGEVRSFLGASASYSGNGVDDVDVCISAHNRIPFIDAGRITGIDDNTLIPAQGKDSGVMYDLEGRRLNAAPQKGIYIKDGRKVLAE